MTTATSSNEDSLWRYHKAPFVRASHPGGKPDKSALTAGQILYLKVFHYRTRHVSQGSLSLSELVSLVRQEEH
jgi:hypothetical protein